MNRKKQNFKYNGKELDKTHGLDQDDYAARYMDPATVRFTSVDPHTENYFSWSPYVYVGNNPIRRIDPNGKDWEDFFLGVMDGFKNNLSIGDTDAVGNTFHDDVDNPNHYNSGRAAGDVISFIMGAAEIVGSTGSTIGSGRTAALLVTGLPFMVLQL